MTHSNRPPSPTRRLALAAAVAIGAAVFSPASPARADVASVVGSAFGSSGSGMVFATPFTNPPTPTVTLPPGGSGAPITASTPSTTIQWGPAFIYSSGLASVSTQGTIGAGGSVTSSTSITTINVTGDEVFTATSASSTCSAAEGSRSASTTLNAGKVRTAVNNPDIDEDDTYVNVPASPPVNHTVHGVIENVGDSFDYVFNEQVVNADGSITVSAGHLKMLGPNATGDVYWGRAVCGVAASGGRYTPLTPARILDTRTGVGGIPGPIGPGATVDVQITGQGGVPASGVTAVAMNVTVTAPTSSGWFTIFPTGSPRPTAANLNFTPGKTIPNLAVVKVGAGGKVSLYNSHGTSQAIFDVAGWYSDTGTGNAGRYVGLAPARILDTRSGVALGPGGSIDLQVSGQGGVPASGALAAVMNVAATSTTATSFFTVYPTGEARPNAANLNFVAGQTASNRVMAKLGTGGKVTIYNNAGSAHVVVDVNGWYTDATVAGTVGAYRALVPARILDTRNGTGGIPGPIAGGTSVNAQVTGQGGVPASVSAVILNATVVSPAAGGYLTISPTGTPSSSSDLNFATGEIRANPVVVRVGTGGKVNIFTSAGTHVIFDVAGWFT